MMSGETYFNRRYHLRSILKRIIIEDGGHVSHTLSQTQKIATRVHDPVRGCREYQRSNTTYFI